MKRTHGTLGLALAAAAALVVAGPASGSEVPGKTNISGFYPTWYFPGHRNFHGTAYYVPRRSMACADGGGWMNDGYLTRRERRAAIAGGAVVGVATGSWVGAGVGAVVGTRAARRWR